MRLAALPLLLLLMLGDPVRSEWEMVCVEDPDLCDASLTVSQVSSAWAWRVWIVRVRSCVCSMDIAIAFW